LDTILTTRESLHGTVERHGGTADSLEELTAQNGT
jgi:hypothetical protein